MLSHDNLAWTAGQAMVRLIDVGPSDRMPSRTCRCRTSPSRCPPSHAPALAGCPGLLRRVDREAGRQPQGGPSPRCSSACRGSGRSSTPGSASKLAEATGAQGSDRRLGAGRSAPRVNSARGTAARPGRRARALQYRLVDRLVYSKLKAGPRLGDGAHPRHRRRADRPRRARVLRQSRHRHPRGLRPVRGHRPDDVQPVPGKTSSASSARPSPASR